MAQSTGRTSRYTSKLERVSAKNAQCDLTKMFNLHGHQYSSNTLISSPHITSHLQSLGMSPLEYSADYTLPLVTPNVLAIGECGLDKTITHPSWDEQLKLFQLHLLHAKKYSLPIILHCVKSYDEIYQQLLQSKFSTPAIFHGYNGSQQQTTQLLKNPLIYFSFGHLLLQQSRAIQSLHLVPLERLFFETDCKPHEQLVQIYQKAAEILQVDCQKLIKQVEANRDYLFGERFHVG